MKSYALQIENLASRPDVLAGYVRYIDCYLRGCEYLKDRVLDVLAGDVDYIQINREVAQTYLKWRESVHSEGKDRDSVKAFLMELRKEIIRRIQKIDVDKLS